jgi:hypothetical protein
MENDKATQEWLGAQKASTRGAYKWSWKLFLEYTNMTGDEILADRRSDKEFKWERKAINVKAHAQEKNLADNTAKAVTTAARSFFAYYHLPLKFRRVEKVKLNEVEPKFTDYQYDINDLKAICDVSDLEEQYVICAGKSFGLRAGDFMRFSRGDFDPYIEREAPVFIGDRITRKEKVPAFSFIDSDTQPIIKLLLAKMTREGRTKPTDKMVMYEDEIQLSRVVQRVTEKAGINLGNKRVRFQCLRKFLSDHLSAHMSESKWKQVVGKKIHEGAYISPNELRDCYMRAMPETTFSKSIIGPQDMEKLVNEILEKRAKEKDCPDGIHCQKVVDETELSNLLSEGWHAELVLPSGKVVINR